jgi:hypothetical protein
MTEPDVAFGEPLEFAEAARRTERFGLFERHHSIVILSKLKKYVT